MTNLPDEIVERVARAIGDSGIEGARLRGWIQLPSELTDKNTDKLLQMAARAALQASGWGEMRFALLKCANAIKRIGDNTGEFGSVTDDRFWDDLWVAEDNARAALAAARGEPL